MPWQIQRQHVPAVIAEIAALQPEQRMVEPGAVDEQHARLASVEQVRGGVGEGAFPVYYQVHQARAAAFSARSRSSIRSCASSRPIDRRTVPGPMPARFRSSSLMR